jgi:acyl-CoA-dependent ceramide synthase
VAASTRLQLGEAKRNARLNPSCGPSKGSKVEIQTGNIVHLSVFALICLFWKDHFATFSRFRSRKIENNPHTSPKLSLIWMPVIQFQLASMPVRESFPFLNTLANKFHSANGNSASRRRRSSVLGQQIQAVETGPFLGTGRASIPSSESSTKFSNSHGRQSRDQKNTYKRRKSHSILHHCKHFAIQDTWLFPLIILLAFLFLYALNPSESNIIHRFIFLSYKLSPEASVDPSKPSQYGKGLWDITLVSFYTVFLTFTREFIMQEMLHPLARLCGIKSRGKQLRFMEQTYTALYFAVTSPAGIFVMRRTPVWYFNTRGMYESYPHKSHEATFKFYYLFQAAYWAQQAIVLLLGMEKPRKDFGMLVGHHIIALALIALSYRFHFTYMGVAVYLTHDISDLFLAVS